ncbi:hypothetical protein V462_09075 [Pantoea ananatis 15320]|nr:hypothetical protein V462_09075 [Pantoea ananatis 15320]PKC47992.1 hypothetical protein V461_01240 [Pantoea ananatis BRT98]CRH35898.1 Uncharacterized protein BN1183_CJ_00360 [Pantoea ananatis]
MYASSITNKFIKENKKRHKTRTRLLFTEKKTIFYFPFAESGLIPVFLFDIFSF